MPQVAVGNWTKIVCPQTSRSWRCSIKVSYVTDNLVLRSPRNCAGLHKWSVTQHMLRRSPLKLTDKIRSLKRRENWWKLLVLGIQTGDKPNHCSLSLSYSQLCRHFRSLAERRCPFSPFHFTLFRNFLGHVTCQNLPRQDLCYLKAELYKSMPKAV